MKSLFRLPFICLCFASLTAQAKEKPNFVGTLSTGFTAAVARILTAGDVLWKKLGDEQAQTAVDRVATAAANLKNEKNDLKSQIISNQITNQYELDLRIQLLTSEALALREPLLVFAEELNKAAPSVGVELRTYIHQVDTSKLEELILVRQKWKLGDLKSHQEAANELNKAIEDLDMIIDASKCLSQTISDQKAACDPKTYEAFSKSQLESVNGTNAAKHL